MRKKGFLALGIIIIVALAGTLIYKNIIKPNRYKEFIKYGNKYLVESNYEKSIMEFEKAIDIYDDSTEARVGEAKAYIGINDIDTAVEKLREAQRLDKYDEQLLKETIDILTPVKPDTAKEFLNSFVSNVGEENLSSDVRVLVEEKKKDKIYTREEVKEYYWKEFECDGKDKTVIILSEESDKFYNNELCYYLMYSRKSAHGGSGGVWDYYIGSKTLNRYSYYDVD